MKASAHIGTLRLSVSGTGDSFSFHPERLVIAGYTARDRVAVQAHIDELADIGIAPPPRVPMFFDVPAALATTDTMIAVDGGQTSGEIEPVLINAGGRFYLGVGSDHTDREVERRDIGESKASAPKPMSTQVFPLEQAVAVWDEIQMVCRLDGDIYQQGSLSAMLTPQALLAELAAAGDPLRGDALMFCGTLPLLTGAFIYGSSYDLELRLPDGTSLHHAYEVKRRDH